MHAALPGFHDVLDAAARIAVHAHATPVLRSRTLDEAADARLHFKAEHLQRAGAFKFRGACYAVFALDDATAARGVVTHSSGNHGAALALAARLRGIPRHVVVPQGAVRAKLAFRPSDTFRATFSVDHLKQNAALTMGRPMAHPSILRASWIYSSFAEQLYMGIGHHMALEKNPK